MVDNKTAERLLAAYQILGLRPGQDAQEVKQAYRALARALHPDRNPEAQVLMARINVAYAVLLEHFKNSRPPRSGFLQRLSQGLNLHLSSWLGGKKSAPAPEPTPPQEDPIITPAPLPANEAHWRLLAINREGKKLIYKVEIFGRPHALALPLRRRRPCRICQGSGKMWEQGQSHTCGNCGGKGYITKPVGLPVPLPDSWQPGQRLPVESRSLSVPLEVELHSPDEETALMEQGDS